ncbi:hypothetical protein [Microbispora sp. KK1-11]|uniref:hypothetical protein n=1 Tax=Microbispora sp. KK1-11 TaxID=2053005 RepID=UPI0011584ABF|nr:hypothetical protein [Microbispora sp. KK1-11]TQS29121.1 hypothetical protein FLW16_12305 [Microbispora sp. KK1-11]
MLRWIPDQGFVYLPPEGPADSSPGGLLAYARQILAEAVAESEAWLLEQERMSPWELAPANLLGRSLIAWWNEDLGFVQEHHPEGQLVAVVAVPVPDLPPPPPEPEDIPAPPAEPGERL